MFVAGLTVVVLVVVFTGMVVLVVVVTVVFAVVPVVFVVTTVVVFTVTPLVLLMVALLVPDDGAGVFVLDVVLVGVVTAWASHEAAPPLEV